MIIRMLLASLVIVLEVEQEIELFVVGLIRARRA